MRHVIGRILMGLALLVAVGGLVLLLLAYWLYGAGNTDFPDRSAKPLVPPSEVELAVRSDRPVGNVAMTADGRLFYTLHPAAGGDGPKLFEWVDGKAVPFPAPEVQAGLFETPLGLDTDGQGRLWVIDTGRQGFGTPQVVALDLSSGEVVHRHAFDRAVAPRGSYLQDLAVSGDGKWVYIADASFWRRDPALVVYNVADQRAHRALEDHETVSAKNILIRTPSRAMSWLGSLVSLKLGVDGIALGPEGQWLYYAAMNHDALFKVPVKVLQNPNTPRLNRAVEIQTVGSKTLSDGIAVGPDGVVYVTDVEHQAVMRITEAKGLETVVKDPRIRWADGLSIGPEGEIYLADSALQQVLARGGSAAADNAPYAIWRFQAPPAPPPPPEMSFPELEQ